jgi:hypothetical protein
MFLSSSRKVYSRHRLPIPSPAFELAVAKLLLLKVMLLLLKVRLAPSSKGIASLEVFFINS